MPGESNLKERIGGDKSTKFHFWIGEGGRKRQFVVDGGTTGKIAREGLGNRILSSAGREKENARGEAEGKKKMEGKKGLG